MSEFRGREFLVRASPGPTCTDLHLRLKVRDVLQWEKMQERNRLFLDVIMWKSTRKPCTELWRQLWSVSGRRSSIVPTSVVLTLPQCLLWSGQCHCQHLVQALRVSLLSPAYEAARLRARGATNQLHQPRGHQKNEAEKRTLWGDSHNYEGFLGGVGLLPAEQERVEKCLILLRSEELCCFTSRLRN